MCANHRSITWPISPGRPYSSADRLWTPVHPLLIDKLRMMESWVHDEFQEWKGSDMATPLNLSVDQLIFLNEILVHKRRSKSVDPEPTLRDTQSNANIFNRMNSATPESTSSRESIGDNEGLFDHLGANMTTAPPLWASRLCGDGTLTPNSQSVILSSQYTYQSRSRTGSATPTLSALAFVPWSHPLALGLASPLNIGSQASTDNPGSPRPSITAFDQGNRLRRGQRVQHLTFHNMRDLRTEARQAPPELAGPSEVEADAFRGQKRKRRQSYDHDRHDTTATTQNDLCPCCKRPKRAHEGNDETDKI